MQNSSLIGKRVMNRSSKSIGVIESIKNGKVYVFDGFDTIAYPYPDAFAETLILEDESAQEELRSESYGAKFSSFKSVYANAIRREISFLKETGGKKYKIVDGDRIPSTNGEDSYIYSFDTDTEMHFPDGTAIRLWLENDKPYANVVACEEFTIIFRTSRYLGEKVDHIEFTAEPWQLMESLIERLDELDEITSPLAYELVCKGKSQVDRRGMISFGQNLAQKKVSDQPITFVWGPPGTGKTTTLARVALDFMNKGKRTLMLSYSNVSVDGATLGVAERIDNYEGRVVRYGYPRLERVANSRTLPSYAYVLHREPELEQEYISLQREKKRCKKNDPKRIQINKKLKKIRQYLLEQEKELIQNAPFVATTVSKAVVDKSVYSQSFDLVIFDEASMAYVPQIVFAAGLASERFMCLGDFKQLPAIVQNPEDKILRKDIFEFTSIKFAVESGYDHKWLVMLNKQFRMHPDVAVFAGKNMYDNLLESDERIYEKRQEVADVSPLERSPMGMIDLSDTYSVCIKTNDGSRINLLSAMLCVRIAEQICEQYEVGIIAPYSAQARLILAMIRDMQEKDAKYRRISSATVHQFQGSERPVIIYDAVDCYRMPYPGVLLTSTRDDTANRLFNVALTRSQGKFLLVANKDYMFRKKIHKDLVFTKLMQKLEYQHCKESVDDLLQEVGTNPGEFPNMFFGERDEKDSWNRFLADIQSAESTISIDIPGAVSDDEEMLAPLEEALSVAEDNGVEIEVRVGENVSVPAMFKKFVKKHGYVTTPFTMIDNMIVWFGEPLSAADFISEGEILETEEFPCLRFEGKYTARMLKAIFEITNK